MNETVLERELAVVRAQLHRNGITTIYGSARFLDPHTIEAETREGPAILKSDYVLIACGTRPAHNPQIPFDGERIIDSDQLRQAKEIPREVIVVGAGVIGLEYASMMAALNIVVTIIDQRSTILDFVDGEIIEALSYHMRQVTSSAFPRWQPRRWSRAVSPAHTCSAPSQRALASIFLTEFTPFPKFP